MTLLPSSLPPTRVPNPREAPAIRWGVLAAGGIAAAFTDTLHTNTSSSVVAVGSRSKDRAGEFAQRFGIERSYGSYEQLVSDPDIDAIYVASPHSEHREHALLALGAGKPVLVEKAFARSAVQALEMVDAASRSALLLMEAMWTRFLPGTDVVRQLLADGALGDLVSFTADHGQWFDVGPEHRILNPDLAGGAILDLGVYPVSYASFVLGAPDTVLATGDLTDTGVDRHVSAVLRCGTAQALIDATLAAKTPTTATMSGTNARIEVDGEFYRANTFRLISRDGDVLSGDPGPLQWHHGLAYEAAHFATLLRDGAVESTLLPMAETVSIMSTLDELRRQVGMRYPGE